MRRKRIQTLKFKHKRRGIEASLLPYPVPTFKELFISWNKRFLFKYISSRGDDEFNVISQRRESRMKWEGINYRYESKRIVHAMTADEWIELTFFI